MTAIGCQVTDEGLGFTVDELRGHLLTGKLIQDTPAGFTWEMGQDGPYPGLWRFVVATRDLYDAVVRPALGGQKVPPFRYEEDLHEFYRRRLLRRN